MARVLGVWGLVFKLKGQGLVVRAEGCLGNLARNFGLNDSGV